MTTTSNDRIINLGEVAEVTPKNHTSTQEVVDLLRRIAAMPMGDRVVFVKALGYLDEGRVLTFDTRDEEKHLQARLRYFKLSRGQYPTAQWQQSCIRGTRPTSVVVYDSRSAVGS